MKKKLRMIRKANSLIVVKGKGFTLIEMLIVVVIIAILASLAIPVFVKTVEKARDKEAKAVLKLIRTGEKIYRLENPWYFPYDPPSSHFEDDVSDINTALRLDLDPDFDTDSDAHWDYDIWGIPGSDDFNARARRCGSDGRWWHIKKSDTEPVSGAGP